MTLFFSLLSFEGGTVVVTSLGGATGHSATPGMTVIDAMTGAPAIVTTGLGATIPASQPELAAVPAPPGATAIIASR